METPDSDFTYEVIETFKKEHKEIERVTAEMRTILGELRSTDDTNVKKLYKRINELATLINNETNEGSYGRRVE